jgi:hypothetical protein
MTSVTGNFGVSKEESRLMRQLYKKSGMQVYKKMGPTTILKMDDFKVSGDDIDKLPDEYFLAKNVISVKVQNRWLLVPNLSQNYDLVKDSETIESVIKVSGMIPMQKDLFLDDESRIIYIQHLVDISEVVFEKNLKSFIQKDFSWRPVILAETLSDKAATFFYLTDEKCRKKKATLETTHVGSLAKLVLPSITTA